MCRVHNKHHRTAPPDAIYVGRPSKFGNPFQMGRDGDRDAVCDKFEAWIAGQPELQAAVRAELRGRDLVCFCAPLRCHADTLLRIANSAP